MLKFFARNKLVSVYRKDNDILVAHGVLEDDIYGLEVDVELGISNLEIVSIGGRWKRAENSQCQRAVPFLQEAVGFRMEDDFTQKVQKVVGRRACRHFADIILECCHAAQDAAVLIGRKKEQEKALDTSAEEAHAETTRSAATEHSRLYHKDPVRKETGLFANEKVNVSGETIIDLHCHTFPASPCSSAAVDELITEAKRIGLDGMCLTDHNYVWDPQEVADLSKKRHFLLLRGNEITTDQGDMIVFGLDLDIKGIIKLDELREEVSKAGGFVIVAHPFRGFLTFGVGRLGLTPEKAMERILFKFVDAVEVLNGKVTEKENQFAAKVAEGLKLPTTGGSDAHEVSAVGIFATRFFQPIRDEKGLVEALKSGNYSPVVFRGERDKAHGR
ncbi:MAG: PHP domain-containing protein [Desulfomonilaceae bacterium]